MKREKQVNELFDKLGSYKPEVKNREDLISGVMASTSGRRDVWNINIFLNNLFGWTEYLWVRRTLASVSIVLIALFVTQQVIIIKRIDSLEYRMVDSNTKQLLEHQQKNIIINSAIMTKGEEDRVVDSILVADKDLRSLIDSYTSMQKQYEDLQDAYIKNEKSKRKL
ncbi:MAG: hypothetical protein QNK33_01535 [Bacteroidales bacterium]|nr:hypothetical protein [Bacteroidales bacterium]